VDVATDGHAGLAAARERRPDLVILDLMLPGLDGYRVLKALRDDGLDIPVLILTAHGEEADKVRGFRLGADDYVTKPFGILELIARVAALLRRTTRGSGAARGPVEQFGDVTIDPATRIVSRHGDPVPLTPMEFDLLLALVRRRGAVASRLELLQEVWGHSSAVLTRTWTPTSRNCAASSRRIPPRRATSSRYARPATGWMPADAAASHGAGATYSRRRSRSGSAPPPAAHP
jgi:two-component system response regulator MtrA